MIRLYAAANLQDAHIVLGLLHSEGISARILNAAAQGGLGEIPFTQAYPEVWIADGHDATRARAIVARFEAAPTDSPAVRRCPACGEESPGSFALCWQCGGALPAA